MAEITGHYISVGRYERIYYECAGEGRPVICLPTAGASSGEYHHLIRYLGDKGYLMVSLDPPGHGNSLPDLKDMSVPSTPEEYIDFVWRFTEIMGFEKPAFIGYAVAGTAMLLLGSRYGSRVGAIVAGEANARLRISPVQLNSLNHPGINMADLMESTTPGLCGENRPAEIVNEAIWHNSRHCVPEVIEADLNIYDSMDITGVLDKISCPVLHTKGDHDYCVTEESMILIKERIPSVKQVILKNTGHYGSVERPQELAGMIEEFFAENYPA